MKYILALCLLSLSLLNARIQESIRTITAEEEQIMQQISIGARYRHYSGKEYIVTGIVRSSEDLTLQVVYEGFYDCEKFGPKPQWVRPLNMFIEEVEINGIKQPRFTKISE